MSAPHPKQEPAPPGADRLPERRFDIRVPDRKSRERLDAYLTREIPELTRNKVQKLIREGLVTVNGLTSRPNRPVLPADAIVVRIPKPPPQAVAPESIPLDVVFEDEHLLVVNKPAGMVVHPACGHFTGTLVNALLGRSDGWSGENGPERRGIVHRLDKGTSGLLVVAKSDPVHAGLAVQFERKSVEREYRAVVWGVLPKSSGTVETLLSRSVRDRRRVAVASRGKRAVTHYRILERFGFLSHVSLRLETGRTHQIRVHMAHLGHPVFGDPEYGGRERRAAGRKDGELAEALLDIMPRQALHAKTLGFVHPVTGEKMRFDSELPEDLEELLKRLRGRVSDGGASPAT
jgi:23S rRNA pseudouridine1911/1915/1917 synthase